MTRSTRTLTRSALALTFALTLAGSSWDAPTRAQAQAPATDVPHTEFATYYAHLRLVAGPCFALHGLLWPAPWKAGQYPPARRHAYMTCFHASADWTHGHWSNGRMIYGPADTTMNFLGALPLPVARPLAQLPYLLSDMMRCLSPRNLGVNALDEPRTVAYTCPRTLADYNAFMTALRAAGTFYHGAITPWS